MMPLSIVGFSGIDHQMIIKGHDNQISNLIGRVTEYWTGTRGDSWKSQWSDEVGVGVTWPLIAQCFTSQDKYMTLQDIVEKGVAAAEEIGNILKNAFFAIYNTDIEVTVKYVLIFGIAILLIFGLGILRAELEIYRVRNENGSKKLPWYLRARALFVAIIILYTVIFVLIF